MLDELIETGQTCRYLLLDVCHADVRDSLLIEVELKGLQSDTTTSGRGPTFVQHARERHVREVDRAKRLGKEMFNDQADVSEGLHIDPKSSHRPKGQRRHTNGKKQSTSRVPCTNTAQLSNAMPEQNMVQTATGAAPTTANNNTITNFVPAVSASSASAAAVSTTKFALEPNRSCLHANAA